MTAIVYSEGALDLGTEAPFEQSDAEGPLRVLIRQTLDGCEWLLLEARPLGKVHAGKETHGLSGNARKVLRVLRDAERDNDDAVFVVIDRDGLEGRGRLAALRRGREQAEATGATVPAALGVAQEMVEAWLLGDSKGWTRFCGQKPPPSLPSDPEVDTGSSRSKRPAKSTLQRCVEEYRHDGENNVVLYTRLAKNLDWEEVAKSCPRSFEPFAKEVRERVGKRLSIIPQK